MGILKAMRYIKNRYKEFGGGEINNFYFVSCINHSDS